MKFYIKRQDLKRMESGCDLGDSIRVHVHLQRHAAGADQVYMYPRKDMLPELIRCEAPDYISDLECDFITSADPTTPAEKGEA